MEQLSTRTERTIEVRVHHEDAVDGPTIGWFPIAQLQELIEHFGRWGICDEDGNVTSNAAGGFSGQFRLNATDVYFEIIVHPAG